MSGVAGYKASVRKTGTPTAMSSQAMSTYSTAPNTYRINSATRRVWNRDAALTFYKDDGSTAGGRTAISTASISSINYLFGTVTFASTQAEPITVSGQFLPTAVVAGANSYGLNLSRELLDDTDFESTGWRSRTPGMLDGSLTVSRFNSTIMDFIDMIRDGSEVVMEVRFGDSGSDIFRGFFTLETDGVNGDVSALEMNELNFVLDGDSGAAAGFGST